MSSNLGHSIFNYILTIKESRKSFEITAKVIRHYPTKMLNKVLGVILTKT